MADPAFILEPQLPGGGDETIERLQNAAGAAATWDVVHRPTTPDSFHVRIEDAARSLAQLERYMASQSATRAAKDPRPETAHSALQELRSQRRSLRTALAAIAGRQQGIALLPRVVFAGKREEPRLAAVAQVYLSAVNGAFSAASLATFVTALQAREPLTLDELGNIDVFLQFALLESLLRDALAWIHSARADFTPVFFAQAASLHSIRRVEWGDLIEPLIVFDAVLRQDPAGAYEKMDLESRQRYRGRIALIARRSDCTELEVAEAALELARQQSTRSWSDPRIRARLMHVGYYLVDNGISSLARRVGFHPTAAWRIRQAIRNSAEDFYIGGVLVLSFAFLALVLFPVLPQFSGMILMTLTFLVLLAPAMQLAVDVVNQSITAVYEPQALPKMDFSKGIPSDCATLVVVPTLLMNKEQVRGLVSHLEVRFLANRDPNLHFALLTDLPDSVTKPRQRDTNPLVELAVSMIDELNAKYTSQRNGSFMLLHRHRIFNQRQGVWMSWERKRGKLLDLNSLLSGEHDSFPIKAGPIEMLKGIRYVLTLDSDTQLPRGSAAQLVGAIAHPLNQAVIDPKLRVVTSGYGILQPRVGVAVRSTVRSRLAAIFSGQSGFDVYTRAVSDTYQDLFGEGIYTGKGIYEVASLHAVLNHRFPRNALLSHDLIEGAYARAGLVTDIEVVDDYPSHYSAYSRRQHRWLRGDWQIAQWIFGRVPDESGNWGPNPISAISRWKIFDNLRRSLVDPSLFVLLVAGWIGLPGGPLYWTVAALCLLAFPMLVQVGYSLCRALLSRNLGQIRDALSGFGPVALLTLLRLILLCHQTLLNLDAVFRSLVRRFITGERTLEWETAAQAESHSVQTGPVDLYLAAMPLTALGLAALIILFAVHRHAIFYAAPILTLWAFSSFVTAWLNRRPPERTRLNRGDREFLLTHALRTWRFFAQFSSARHNHLIPDNVTEEGLEEAARISPTNVGMLLNARQAACELGFLTVPEFAALTSQSLSAIARLKKFRGNLFNWYDTETLDTLGVAPLVSSVDSGNLVASLYTLCAGARELVRKPLLHPRLFPGLRAHWQILRAEKGVPDAVAKLRPPRPFAAISAWIEWLPVAETALEAAATSQPGTGDCGWWLNETLRRVSAIQTLLRDYLPWMLPEYELLRKPLGMSVDRARGLVSVEDAVPFAGNLQNRISSARAVLASDALKLGLAEQLQDSLPAAIEKLRALAAELRAIERHTAELADATDLSCFVNPDRQVLSIGYDTGKQKIHEACYDLFASEARLATFLAVARGDLPQRSWFQLEREFAYAAGRFLVYSWTGTMFEYLMPGLWMHSHRGTFVAETEAACVHVQCEFARPLHIPWGISESGSARRNEAGQYGYRAYGVPWVALSPEATAGPVISPYSTFLALNADPAEALHNLRRMDDAGWVGPFGFYEAADYSHSLRAPVIVREWMAHHQGMSLLALTNLLRNNVIRHWFHANPIIQSTERLLHEVPVREAALKARRRELTPAVST